MSTTPIPELTPWFPGDVKPVRKGMYLRQSPTGNPVYAKWTGRRWLAYAPSIEMALSHREGSIFSDLPWRGLAEGPK